MTKKKDDTASEKINTALVSKASREPFFGTLLFGFMILSGIVVFGGAGFAIYHGIEFNQKQAALPSISGLSQEVIIPEVVPEEERKGEESAPGETQISQEADMKKAQATAIKVLNGGASKGSAGTLGEFLKKKMFTQVTVGNTLTDYTGTVVYYGSEFEKEAGLVRDVMLETYPKTETRPSIPSNSETRQAPLTIIVGK